ncbi:MULTISPECIES: multidrug efflux transporter transcriptional repressor AcrR [Rahnella]|uniref:Multidrug efflux transporter transcriptional repressor AcrR n=1 Tax=Rahnella laticis TaxID=2787622 RepID=A0ABS0E4S1_9GAMM|nr:MULTISPECIES: multidrug efflux transporter transcriptional repressor AcrR [Rahnella]MBF7980041.1 multidrug efflux transporter transcriptional repressor AcrR [Rahnella laticis]MBF7994177.1 multidrug efflux transporter transcriptional repressor AcrR [Rahnella laticis]MBF8000131.1 multidrug efflux transporter transcriptional repressor AcrR [Rahnella sp. LAC-M12]MBU9820687.1 multidrug efflux transporter transcriptional repressor AcrR [Rahnella sp. BCC 1045]MDF1893014.1 multidrug efflux transpor
MARKTKSQALETRQHILDAAVREFSARGVSSTSLTDIANAAGVTRGAIYWHFRNKVELFNAIWEAYESQIKVLELEYQTKFPNNPLRILREILIYILVATVTDPQRKALMEIIFHKCEFVGEMTSVHEARKSLYMEGYGKIERILERCIKEKQLPATLDTRQAAVILRAYLTGLMENWLFIPESFDLQSNAERFVDTYLDMLRHSSFLVLPPKTV